MTKILAVGSGPGGVDFVNKVDTRDVIVVGVNNTWKGTRKWDHMIHAGDYPDKHRIATFKPHQDQNIHSKDKGLNYEDSYCRMTKKPWQKARIWGGLPIYFTCMYWCLYYLRPTHIGCVGFDMDYTPGENGATAFYGVGHDIKSRGVPDPLYQFKKHYKDLENPMLTLQERLEKIATEEDCKIVNLSDNPNTQLKWEQVSYSTFLEL